MPPGDRNSPSTWASSGGLRVWIDLLVLGIPLVLLNYFLFREDRGWFATNPSPFVLLPFLIGVRYGFASGILAGAVAAATSLALFVFGTGGAASALSAAALDHRFPLCALIVLGGIAGAVGQWIRNRAELAEVDAAHQKERADDAEARAEVYAEAAAEMERRLVFHGVDFAGLGDELGRIVRQPEENQASTFLEVLRKISGVRAAAIYSGKEAESFLKNEELGSASCLPDRVFISSEDALFAKALNQGTVVTQKGLWDSPPQRQPGVLLAAPLGRVDESGKRSLLAIADMEYLAVSEENFLRIRMLCRWMGLLTLGGSGVVPGAQQDASINKRIVSSDEFIDALNLAAETAREQSRPSTVASLSLPGAERLDTEILLRLLWSHLRGGGMATLVAGHPARLFLLFPARAGEMCEREIAEISPSLVDPLKLQEQPRTATWVVDGGESGRGLWGAIIQDG